MRHAVHYGQTVYPCQAKLSIYRGPARRDNMSMGKRQSPAAFRKGFQARIKLLRDAAGFSQEEMARELGVHKDTYAKWENRENSLMPHDVISVFLGLTGGSYEYLFEGRSAFAAKNGGDQAAA